jgi:hypothetical protein
MRILVALVFASLMLAAGPAFADGCYVCGGGSKCGDYCRYSGADNFEARRACEKKGCKVSGTGPCPTKAGAKVCALPATSPILACVGPAPAITESRLE